MAIIARRRALDRLPTTTCPAAASLDGAVPANCGVICRVMQMDREREAGLDMNPVQLAIARDGSDGVLMTLKSDPNTIERFCCGDAVPVVNSLSVGGGRASYTYCPVWQAEKDRIAEGRDMLAEEAPPEPVSMGVSTQDADDPWAQGRRDLDLLAGV